MLASTNLGFWSVSLKIVVADMTILKFRVLDLRSCYLRAADPVRAVSARSDFGRTDSPQLDLEKIVLSEDMRLSLPGPVCEAVSALLA
ncbi:hypothetical protein sscle_08g063340 [Sclerotinia sclerotiorum 1980 UF-70]|nr:hypothetical protein sscle_08g063340 [Sclerotinia sclerotiorum 1980 UF-70]